MIKKITKLLLIILILAFSFLVFDLTKYDSSYINRNSITFNSNNLDSKIAIKFDNKFLGIMKILPTKFIIQFLKSRKTIGSQKTKY